jgi:small basic protein (TIGR04137 family)
LTDGLLSKALRNLLVTGAFIVSIDKTLRTQLGLSRARNVLTRGERIARLIEEDRFAAGRSPLGLPKVRVQKALIGKKKKKTAEEGAPAAAAAAPAKGAKGKK